MNEKIKFKNYKNESFRTERLQFVSEYLNYKYPQINFTGIEIGDHKGVLEVYASESSIIMTEAISALMEAWKLVSECNVCFINNEL